jgi:class 3 adenylate cyclase
MHRELKDLLASADGHSQRVIVVFLDIRGFSSFARVAESSDAADFLKSVYVKILDSYFKEPDFFKLTGDGLMIIRRFDDSSLKETVKKVVEDSLRLVNDFDGICADDDMINFEVPGGLGIGIARGAATALVSQDKILDYSGRPLNLAARLMDLARPHGVIFDRTLKYSMLPKDLQDKFVEQEVFVRGIADNEPVIAYHTKGVEVPETNLAPLDGFDEFVEPVDSRPLREWDEVGTFSTPLSHKPARADALRVQIMYPKARKNGSKHPTLRWTLEREAQLVTRRGKTMARVDYRPIVKEMKADGAKPSWSVSVQIEYPVRVDKTGKPLS